ncbi:MAG TPA: VOC family protein [Longimicrobium sp.]|nr:VOC family protein [Longimicrobium sp.]
MPTILQNHHVLAVPDVRASAAFFVDALGFQVVDEPPGWIFVARDDCMIMLGECPDAIHPGRLGDHGYFAYLRVDDADGYLAQVRARGFAPIAEIEDKPWGMREFAIRTPEGHRLTIGQVIGRPDAA